MPYVKIYIHCVWSTKNRTAFLNTREIREKVWKHILANAREKGIFIDSIGGYKEHCHCLISLGKEQNLSNIMKLLKGESSHWINSNTEIIPETQNEKFAWQDDYFAVSVSESIVPKVREYIMRQEQHHKLKTFTDEYQQFVAKYGFADNK